MRHRHGGRSARERPSKRDAERHKKVRGLGWHRGLLSKSGIGAEVGLDGGAK